MKGHQTMILNSIARSLLTILAASSALFANVESTVAAERPNILWLTTEDIGPHLGCYGDTYATTPHLDAFAKRSVRYRNAWSNGPVCAAARTTLISGLYPPSTGAENMRCLVPGPAEFAMYPQLLRAAGYRCINPGKEDYNLEKPGQVWDLSDKNDPWKGLKDQQPFMAVFNHQGTHESQIRTRPHVQVHDPAQAPVPPYHPVVPEVQEDWAQYYDKITEMDDWFGEQIAELERQGLADNTIVFFYGDHGSGMPRNKRLPYHAGLHVPLLIHIPAQFQSLAEQGTSSGGVSERLVGFVDFAPTLCRLAGVAPPNWMQGAPFLGENRAEPPRYAFGFRGRMDERYDLIRTVRNHRYQYIRNYFPHLPYGQHNAYMFLTPTTTLWKSLFDAGQLDDAQSRFWRPKPVEELYDLEADPHEIHNLAESPEHQAALQELRTALRDWILEIRDLGFLPEDELQTRAPSLSPYDLGHDPVRYPLERILQIAEQASDIRNRETAPLVEALSDSDSAVRYWGALGLVMRSEALDETVLAALRQVLQNDSSPSVQVQAAAALGQGGTPDDLQAGSDFLINAADGRQSSPPIVWQSLNAIHAMGEDARPLTQQLEAILDAAPQESSRTGSYQIRLLEKILHDLQNSGRPR